MNEISYLEVFVRSRFIGRMSEIGVFCRRRFATEYIGKLYIHVFEFKSVLQHSAEHDCETWVMRLSRFKDDPEAYCITGKVGLWGLHNHMCPA